MRTWPQYLAGGLGAVMLVLLLLHPQLVIGVGLLLWLAHRGHRAVKRNARRDEERGGR